MLAVLDQAKLWWVAPGVLIFAAVACGEESTKSPDPCWVNPGGCAGGAPGSGGSAPLSGSGGTPSGGSGGAAIGGGGSAGALGGGPAGGSTSGGSGGSGGSVAGAGGTGGSGGTPAAGAGSGGTLTGGAGAGGKAGGGGAGAAGAGACTGGTLPVCLAHRYSFDGTGSTVTDSVGAQNGTAVGASVAGGDITLSGTDQYVNLPDGLASRFTSATFEAWVTWSGGTGAWHRIFDFGNNTATMGDQGVGTTYLFLSPRNGTTQVVRAAFTVAGATTESFVDGTAPLPATQTHVAVVVNGSSQTLELFVGGASVGSTGLAGSLSALMDTTNWLGRSQYAADPDFAGSIQEFRIYGIARSAAQISASFTAGPGALPAQ